MSAEETCHLLWCGTVRRADKIAVVENGVTYFFLVLSVCSPEINTDQTLPFRRADDHRVRTSCGVDGVGRQICRVVQPTEGRIRVDVVASVAFCRVCIPRCVVFHRRLDVFILCLIPFHSISPNKLIPASLTLGAAGCVTLPDFAFAISNIEAKLS